MKKKIVIFLSLFLLTGFCFAKSASKGEKNFQLGSSLSPLSSLESEEAEITAYMAGSKTLFAVGGDDLLEIIDLSSPDKPRKIAEKKLPGDASSVTVFENWVAVSLLNDDEWKMGQVQLMRYDGSLKIEAVHDVCAGPDMITFTPDGSKLLVACEGSPSDDGKVDPIGAVAVIEREAFASSNSKVSGITLIELDREQEPEYIAVSDDSKWAWVSLQETNEMARIDVAMGKLDGIFDLGYVDHSKPGFAVDAVKDGKIDIRNENIRSLREPDGIAHFEADGRQFVVTANEGEDSRQPDMQKVCGTEKSCSVRHGSRSISIFDGKSGAMLWDSGEILERMLAQVAPEYFNWNSKKGKKKVDSRSDDKGAEPENVTIGMVEGRRYCFVGLERMSGVAVFDLTDFKVDGNNVVQAPKLVDYLMDPKDRGPEGILFIPADKSPIKGQALLVVGFEYSENVSVFKVNAVK